jgi:hypothetical protein
MMRALLFLSIVGAAIYGFLVITGDALSGGNTSDGLTIQAKPDHSADDRLSSWGSHLPSRSQSRNPQLASSQQPATLPSQERSDPNQNSEQYRLAAPENRERSSESDGLKSESSIATPAPAQVAAESTTEPLTVAPPSQKSNKRHRSAKPAVRDRVVVGNADPWNERWARRADRRRGAGLIMFHPFGSWAQGR